MEVTRTELQKHVSQLNAILQETCDASDPAPFVNLINDSTIALAPSCPVALRREVTTDLGNRELALRLPIPDSRNPKFWIGIQEVWKWKTRHRVAFVECGLRVYIGERNDDAAQFLRLEWVAPDRNSDGSLAYHGAHAGHPHWHVDRSALIGKEDYLRSLMAPTEIGTEEFGDAAQMNIPLPPTVDFSWIQEMHLPARAQWMHSKWDGVEVPGPHQCEPENLEELAHWWAGALRYVSAELPR
jgi:hypothetical protein